MPFAASRYVALFSRFRGGGSSAPPRRREVGPDPVGARVSPPRPREGVGATPLPDGFFRDCSERVIDRELKFGIADS